MRRSSKRRKLKRQIAAAASEVASGLGQAEALGVVSAIEGLSQANEQMDAALEQIAAVSNSVEQAQVAVQTVAGSP